VPLAPPTLPRVEEIGVSTEVLVLSVTVLCVAGLIAALLPAAQAWRADLTRASREESRTMTGSARLSRARSALVVLQISLTLPLLVGGALLTRTFTTLMAASPGFVPGNVLSLNMAIPRTKYRDDEAVSGVVSRIHERVSQIPGVDAAGLVNRLPLGGGAQLMMLDFDAPRQLHPYLGAVDSRVITPGYFRALGIPIIEGRDFTSRDTATATPVGIVDERVAQLMWPGESAIGKRFRFASRVAAGLRNPWLEIVGVAGHVKHDGIDVDPHAQVYWNYLQRAQDRMSLVVRANNAPGLTSAVIAAIHDVDPEQPVFDVRTMDEVVRRSLSQRWMNMVLVGSFAIVALVLCSIGVYGVIAFGVTQQRREFGIRLALGASRAAITSSVVTRGLVVAAIGIAVGLLLALAVAGGMTSVLVGVQPRDLASFGIAATIVLLVVVVASYLPARQAAAVDPAATLRGD
jgi:predicted permease